MVAQILQLKLILLANAFRRTPWQVVGLLLGLFYGLGTSIFLASMLVALRFFEVELARSIVTVFGAIVLIIFAILPLILGIDDVLDPRKFSLFGISNTVLALSIGVASLLSVPAVVISIIAVAQTATWSRDPAAFSVSIVATVLIIVTCVLSARISTTVATLVLSTRRARDIATIIGLALVVAGSPVLAALSSVDWAVSGLSVLRGIADVVGWTPIGAAWAAPADIAAGYAGSGYAKLVIAVIWVGLLFVIWRVLLGGVLVSRERQAQAKKYLGLGWFDRLPKTPTGAIAARSLTYWARDARYLTSLVIIPIIPAFMVISLNIAGLPLSALALLPVPVMCLFLSWSVHNDVSFDNTAIWLHIASSTRGTSDRLGRLLPALTVGTALIVVGSVLSAAIYGDWQVLPSLVGVSSSILLIGLGLSSIMSARFPYPAVRPGDSPFSQPQAGGNAAGLIQALSFFGITTLSAPAIVFAVLGLIYGLPWAILSLVTGLGVGALALALGVNIGGRVFDRRGPEILAAALRN